MKKIYTKRKFSVAASAMLLAVMLVSVLFYACKKPTDGINVLVDSNSLFPAPTLLKFNNADSTSTNQPTGFTVDISGPGAKYVQLSSGGTDFKVTSSLLALALTKDANPSETNPINFTVTANLTGFAPVVQNISITKNALSVYPVKMLEYARPPIGTTVLSTSTPLTSGKLGSFYLLSTSRTATMNELASITFAANTQMQDANGNNLSGTSLVSNIVQYGTGTDASLQAFPGGMTAPVAYKSDNTPIAGGVNFVTAGLLQINMEASGVAVKKFSQPATVSIEINENTVNFATNAVAKVGDVIPVWSMNESTGVWTNEAAATIVIDSYGRKAAQFSITHLSCWNLDWTWGAFGAYGTCGSKLEVKINPSDLGFTGGPYEITLQTPSGQYLGALHGATITKDFVATFQSVPNIPLAKIVVSGGVPYTRVQTSTFSPCSAGSVSVTVPVGSVNPINVSFNIRGLCSGKDVVVLPSATFELYVQTSGSQSTGTAVFADAGSFQIVNGLGKISMQEGKQYYFTTTYNNVQYKTDPFSVSKSDIAIPSSTSALNASAKYDAATNTLKVAGTIPVNCN